MKNGSGVWIVSDKAALSLSERGREEAMARIVKPTAEEFELVGNHIIHKPTGAIWMAHEGRREPHSFRRNGLGDELPNGDEYYPEEVAALARKLLADRIKPF